MRNSTKFSGNWLTCRTFPAPPFSVFLIFTAGLNKVLLYALYRLVHVEFRSKKNTKISSGSTLTPFSSKSVEFCFPEIVQKAFLSGSAFKASSIVDGGTRPHIEIVCSRQMWMQASTLGSLRDQKEWDCTYTCNPIL